MARPTSGAAWDALKRAADAAGVSLSDYLLGEISRVAARPPVADVLARASLRGQGVERDVVADAVRAGRDLDRG